MVRILVLVIVLSFSVFSAACSDIFVDEASSVQSINRGGLAADQYNWKNGGVTFSAVLDESFTKEWGWEEPHVRFTAIKGSNEAEFRLYSLSFELKDGSWKTMVFRKLSDSNGFYYDEFYRKWLHRAIEVHEEAKKRGLS